MKKNPQGERRFAMTKKKPVELDLFAEQDPFPPLPAKPPEKKKRTAHRKALSGVRLCQVADCGQGGGGAVSTGGGQLPDVLGAAVPGGKHTGHRSAAVFPHREETVFVQ